MRNYFDYLPNEIILIMFKYMTITEKEHLTNAFPIFYHLFKETKRNFLEENYQINYKPLVKKGIEFYIESNKLCINAIIKKKKFYIDSFPEPLRRFFINYDTPIIPYKCSFVRSSPVRLHVHNVAAPVVTCSSLRRKTGIFDCKGIDLKHKISVGRYPTLDSPKNFILIKTKNGEIITLWETEFGTWNCYFEELVYYIIGPYYVNFHLLNIIVELL